MTCAPAIEAPEEVITSLERLDEKLAEISAAWAISDDAVRSVFGTFRMEFDSTSQHDPWSAQYREEQFDLYRRVSSRPDYVTASEVSGFPVDPRRPFPYYTESPSTVGDQLLAIGFMIKTMALPSGSTILEFGPGWGNTTIALSRMGYNVTAVDIDPTFVDLIAERAQLLGLELDARVGEFLDPLEGDRRYDAVLFYECFHHCSDHVALLRRLHSLVNDGGSVILASEPILESFHAPWGLRLDGESLWAIRQNGWLELGFTESYFIETCMREGWSVTRSSSDVSALTTVFSLTQLGQSIKPGAIRLPPTDEASWAIPDSPPTDQRYTSERSRLVCPVGKSWTSVRITVRNPAPHPLPCTVRHGADIRHIVIPGGAETTLESPYSPDAGEMILETEIWRPSDAIKGSGDSRLLGLAVMDVTFW